MLFRRAFYRLTAIPPYRPTAAAEHHSQNQERNDSRRRAPADHAPHLGAATQEVPGKQGADDGAHMVGSPVKSEGEAGAAGASTGFAALAVGLGTAYTRSPRFLFRHPGPAMLTATAALAWWGVL